jgi:hypothetical protein
MTGEFEFLSFMGYQCQAVAIVVKSSILYACHFTHHLKKRLAIQFEINNFIYRLDNPPLLRSYSKETRDRFYP